MSKIQEVLDIIAIGYNKSDGTYSLTSTDIRYIEEVLMGLVNQEDSDGLVIRYREDTSVHVYERGKEIHDIESIDFHAEVNELPMLDIRRRITWQR